MYLPDLNLTAKSRSFFSQFARLLIATCKYYAASYVCVDILLFGFGSGVVTLIGVATGAGDIAHGNRTAIYSLTIIQPPETL